MINKTQGTEPQIAPEPMPVVQAPQPIQPRQKVIERQGSKSEPYTEHWPQVRGGTCEFCGTLDANFPAEQQYKLCPHYRGMQLRCSYCDESKDPDQVIGHSVLNVHGHPDNPDKLVVVCDSYNCSRAHEARFRRTAQ